MPDAGLHVAHVLGDKLGAPLHDVGEVDLLDRGLDAELFSLPDDVDDVGGVDHHLRWDAAPVQAGAAEGAHLHHGDDHPPVERGVGDGHAGTRADNEDVEFLHNSQ